jgi:hypothetical protein
MPGGKWQKGAPSPNPSGRPKSYPEIVALARENSPAAIRKLVDIMTTTADEKAAISAANAVLDRAFGKPAQSVAVSDRDSLPEELRSMPDSALAELTLEAVQVLRGKGGAK